MKYIIAGIFLLSVIFLIGCSSSSSDIIAAKEVVKESQEQLEEIAETNPATLLSERCILEPGLTCVGPIVEPTKITLIIKNGRGKDITINEININGCPSTSFNKELPDGSQDTFILSGCDIKSNMGEGRFKSDIEIKYVDKEFGLTKTAFGELSVNI